MNAMLRGIWRRLTIVLVLCCAGMAAHAQGTGQPASTAEQITAAEQAVAAAPDSIPAALHLLGLYVGAGRKEDAARELTRALGCVEQARGTWVTVVGAKDAPWLKAVARAALLGTAGDLEAMQAELRSGQQELRTTPPEPPRPDLHAPVRSYGEEIFEAALKAPPTAAAPLLAGLTCLGMEGTREQTVAFLEQATTTAPDLGLGLLYLSLLIRGNDPERSLALARRACVLLPPGIHATLAGHAAANPPEQLPPLGENLALRRPYTMSPPSDYPLCLDDGDAVQLTNGKHARYVFWRDPEAVGWKAGPALLTVDLGEDRPIKGLSFSTVAGAAGIKWPPRCLIAVSPDGQSWYLLGDLVALNKPHDNLPEIGYAARSLWTDALKTHGRYLALRVEGSPFVFCDEIEVYRGDDAFSALPYASPPAATALDAFSQEELRRQFLGDGADGPLPRFGPNVALNRPYELTPAPTYERTTEPGDATQLTDGVYEHGVLWAQKGAVGWHGAGVLIQLDLGTDQPIRGLSYSTDAGNAGVAWPASIRLSVSRDGTTWTALGDLVELNKPHNNLPAEGHASRRIWTNALQSHGRYLQLDVHPTGGTGYVFCDEIEVYGEVAGQE